MQYFDIYPSSIDTARTGGYNDRTDKNTSKGEYRCEQNGMIRKDGLSGESLHYKNVFILVCDTTTYEKSDTTELVLEFAQGGQGYYFTGGTLLKFKWKCDAGGNLSFTDQSGQQLIINRGDSYIAFYKTTQKASISIY